MRLASHQQAWEMVLGDLRAEMERSSFETWVQPLQPLSYQEGVFTVGAVNPYGREWVLSRLKSRVTQLLSGYLGKPVTFEVMVVNTYYKGPNGLPEAAPQAPAAEQPQPVQPAPPLAGPARTAPAAAPSARKLMLQRAYGSEKARIIQPERGMFITQYFFSRWLPLLGHSAVAVILAARSMCYWNPMTGEKRNIIETEMGELAQRAAVSLRTVKQVLSMELVQRYFLRYTVRRMMTPNGVRTAGIRMLVRMDDPLTPPDQEDNNLVEEDDWYTAEFEGEEEDE